MIQQYSNTPVASRQGQASYRCFPAIAGDGTDGSNSESHYQQQSQSQQHQQQQQQQQSQQHQYQLPHRHRPHKEVKTEASTVAGTTNAITSLLLLTNNLEFVETSCLLAIQLALASLLALMIWRRDSYQYEW
jgi:transcription initiation factor TFIID subunit TAF12